MFLERTAPLEFLQSLIYPFRFIENACVMENLTDEKAENHTLTCGIPSPGLAGTKHIARCVNHEPAFLLWIQEEKRKKWASVLKAQRHNMGIANYEPNATRTPPTPGHAWPINPAFL